VGVVASTQHHIIPPHAPLCVPGMGIIRVRAQRNSGHSHFPAGDGPCQPARRRAHVVPRDSQTLDRCPSRGQRFVGITWMTKLHPSVRLSQMSRFCALDLIASRSATGKLRCATINFTQVFFAPACCLFIRMARSRARHDHKVAQVSSPRNASRYHSSHAVRIRLGQQSDIRQTVRGWNWRAMGGAYPRDTPTFEALMHALQRRIKASRSLYTCRRRTHVHDQLIDSSPS
jgi:hypothetical protein